MKGWRFYEEYKSTKRKVPTGNVVAVDTTQEPYLVLRHGVSSVGKRVGERFSHVHSCVSAVFFQSNSPVCFSSATQKFLRTYCKRISEAKAREIHPRLIEYLEGGQ